MLAVLWTGVASAQQNLEIKGRVLLDMSPKKSVPAEGADVYSLNGKYGTQTNEFGVFTLDISEEDIDVPIVISFVGYRPDTIGVRDRGEFEIVLQSQSDLNEVVVRYRIKSTRIKFMESIKIEEIGEKELQKAACCNLAESFETSPAVDVSFTDAITGTRQIRMLGLSGRYTQITFENMPGIRGIYAIKGMEFIPGTWIESIQLNKGAGSVVNGFESSTGQINLELSKPDNSDRFYLNLFANRGGRFEANIHHAHRFSEKWSTGLLGHVKYDGIQNDRNDDGFKDMPTSLHFIALNRWKYFTEYFRMQFGLNAVSINESGGQLRKSSSGQTEWYDGVRGNRAQLQREGWFMDNAIREIDAFTKMGIVSKKHEDRSMAIQLRASLFDQESFYGNKTYDPSGSSLYANYIFQDKIKTDSHSIRAGLSYQYDNLTEVLNDSIEYNRTEHVPGIYGEYTFKKGTKFSSVLGLRLDHHNLYGAFVTPRLHARYELSENWVYRLSMGRGQRTPNILADNPRIFASNRTIQILGKDNGLPYGLRPEIAWNFGMSLTGNFRLDYRDGQFSVDLYRTNFQDQIIIDFDANPQVVSIYALEGKSYSNSVQVQLDYEVAKRLDMRLAYRWNDVRQDYLDKMRIMPLLSRDRAFLNIAYEGKKKWKYDATFNWTGEQRIPGTSTNPEEFRLKSTSPDFVTVNAQVTKELPFKTEVYVGMENILNFRQQDAIISANDPSSEYFDASMVWGPLFGRNTYIGLRYRLD